MNQVTAIIIHYRRQSNIPHIVGAIMEQTVPADIWIWDNQNVFTEINGVTLFSSSKNFVCRPRFILAGMVQTPYVFNCDDDHIVKDKQLFEKMIALSKEKPDCFWGWPARKEYNNSPQRDAEGIPADLVNTGISFYPTRLINKIMANPYINDSDKFQMTEEEYRYADDHWISAQLPLKIAHPTLEAGIGKMYDHGVALSRDPRHIPIREAAARKFWGNA
jgi:hypothetical protein